MEKPQFENDQRVSHQPPEATISVRQVERADNITKPPEGHKSWAQPSVRIALVAALISTLAALGTWISASATSRNASNSEKSAVAAQENARIAGENAQLSREQSAASREKARIECFLMLKAAYYRVDRELTFDYRAVDFRPSKRAASDEEQKQWRAIRSYWYHSFDEWFVSQRLSASLVSDYWGLYYLPAQLSALNKRALRGVFLDMTSEKDGEFRSGPRKEYAEELNRAYAAKTGKTLTELTEEEAKELKQK